MSRIIATRLSTAGLFLVATTLLGACVIQGPPDGFFDDGEGGYGVGEEGDTGGQGVVGDPVSTSGITEDQRQEWDEDEDDGDLSDGLPDADLLGG